MKWTILTFIIWSNAVGASSQDGQVEAVISGDFKDQAACMEQLDTGIQVDLNTSNRKNIAYFNTQCVPITVAFHILSNTSANDIVIITPTQ